MWNYLEHRLSFHPQSFKMKKGPSKTAISYFIGGTHGWKLHLCLNGSLLETHNGECKYGIWFAEPRVVSKICFQHGVWAIYREFCEGNPIIWTVHPGKKGCLTKDEIGHKIIGITSLGRDEEAGAIVSTSNRRLFFNNHKLKHGMNLTFLSESTFTPAQVEVLTWGSPSITYSLQQVRDDRNGSTLQQCLVKGARSFFAFYKIALEKTENASLHLAKNVCAKPIPRGANSNITRVQVPPSEIDFDIIQSSSEDMDMDSINCEQLVTSDDQVNKNDNAEDESDELEKDATEIERKVDEETQRITLRLLSYHFRDEEFEENAYFNQWKFLDMARQIFHKVCPNPVVPKFFIEQIYLLFQAVLQESFKSFPELVNKDMESRERILAALQVCLANSTKFKFKDGAACINKDTPLLKTEFFNRTGASEGKAYLLLDMPSFIKIDPVNYDLVMESIWKLMNFAHYHCADTFQHLASDHSMLEWHWYSLFSPLVIRRWKYPGRSYQVMQQVFSSINLERSIKNLDFCVSAARFQSSYKGWLKRPLSLWDKIKKVDSVKGTRLIWDEQAHCLDDFTYPAFKLGYPIEKCGILLPTLPNQILNAHLEKN